MFLGIDIGTSGVKAVVLDELGAVVGQGTAALTVQRPHPLWSEQDPEAWWQATTAAVRAIDPAVRRAVRGIGLAGQMHGATLLDADAFWSVPCEVMVPAALEGQITLANVTRIRTRLLVEGANGPTTPDAEDILHAQGCTVLPDVLANAGGVTVSYFEWVQNATSFFWTEQDIHAKLDRVLSEAFEGIWRMAQDKGVNLRTATFITACSRVLQARALRGLYP